jgi:hypothetical protein
VVIRVGARFLGGAIAGLQVAPPELRTAGLGRGLLALGGIGVALALNYGQVYPDLHPRLVLTATLLAVLLFEIVAGREASVFVAEIGRRAGQAEQGAREDELQPLPDPG